MWIFFIIFCFLAYLAFSASVNEHLLVLFLVETTEQPALQFRNGNWGRDLTQVHLPIKSNQTFQKLGSKISYAKILLRTFSIIVSILVSHKKWTILKYEVSLFFAPSQALFTKKKSWNLVTFALVRFFLPFRKLYLQKIKKLKICFFTLSFFLRFFKPFRKLYLQKIKK